MPDEFRVIVVSDIHYASDAEKARRGYETAVVRSWWQRAFVGLFRRLIWLKDPLDHNHMLDRFLAEAGSADLVVANGDYSCDSAFVGVNDDAAFASAAQALWRLRERFAFGLVAGFGDHELGKTSLLGGVGGPRWPSRERALGELGVEECWRRDLGSWVLLGVVSSVLALPVYEPETLPEERERWWQLRAEHQRRINQTFASLHPSQGVVLFCHDPTAIPFLLREPEVRPRLGQVQLTVIGHLHTPLVFWTSRMLAGMPAIRFLGNSVRRMTLALHEARCWQECRTTLCPSLSGCQLLKDGGFGRLRLDADGRSCRWQVQRLRW